MVLSILIPRIFLFIPIANKRPYILQNRTATHKDIRKNRDPRNQCIFYVAVVNNAIVNSSRERNIARQQKRAVKNRQIDFSNEKSICRIYLDS